MVYSYFQKYRNFRTVLVHCERILLLYGMVYLGFPFVTDTLRIYVGNLPAIVCWLSRFFKNFSVVGTQLGFTLALTIRYMAIIKKMNVLGCNDEFFNVFLTILVFLVSFFAGLLHNIVPGKMDVSYFICVGENPEDHSDIRPKVSNFPQFFPNSVQNLH